MIKPEPLNARSEFVKEHMRQFEEKHIKPARERVQAKPDSVNEEAYQLFSSAKAHFKSEARGRPGNKEALYLFALERLDDLVKDGDIAEKAIGDWGRRGSQFWLAKLILYPLNPWPKDTWAWSADGRGHVRVPGTQPGFVDYARSIAESSTFTQAQPQSPHPPPPPRDPVELDLETKVLRAEEELERHRAALMTYRETKEKAAQQQAERDRMARERAEQEARDRVARETAEREKVEREARERAGRERVEREARERAERERRAREQSASRAQSPPQWAVILELTPPYTEEQIRSAYRRKAKLTHPDHGGTAKEFREVDSAYDSAMAHYRTQRTCGV